MSIPASSAACSSTLWSAPSTRRSKARLRLVGLCSNSRVQQAKQATGTDLIINKDFWFSLPGFVKVHKDAVFNDVIMTVMCAGGLPLHVGQDHAQRLPEAVAQPLLLMMIHLIYRHHIIPANCILTLGRGATAPLPNTLLRGLLLRKLSGELTLGRHMRRAYLVALVWYLWAVHAAVTPCTTGEDGLSAKCAGAEYSISNMRPADAQ